MSVRAHNHAEKVDAWVAQVATGLSSSELVKSFERVMLALWKRADITVGTLTLAAIVDRVILTAAEKYPALAVLRVTEKGIDFAELREQEASPSRGEHLSEAVRFVLLEFLTVLGNLTAEILTPVLHEELGEVTAREASNKTKSARVRAPSSAEDDDDDLGKGAPRS